MTRSHPFRTEWDVRDFPRYGISEAAFYVRIPATTLHAWAQGQDYVTRSGIHRTFQPLIKLADPKNKLLSFFNLVEAHILRSTTERGVPFKNIRKALDYVYENIPGEHPLLTHEFETHEREMESGTRTFSLTGGATGKPFIRAIGAKPRRTSRTSRNRLKPENLRPKHAPFLA